MSSNPHLSVIIPFCDNHEEVVSIEERLHNQTYPYEKVQIIFIDNGSKQRFQFSDTFLERNTLLSEERFPNSPYSARNRGIEASSGEIMAFIDANSLPAKDWLERGIHCMNEMQQDIVAGRIEFDFGDEVSAGKIVDSLTSIRMRRAVVERGVAYTANLFVKRELFEELGKFEEGVRSGGDVRWTLRATRSGYEIAYCEEAVVNKRARTAAELYRKRVRTGRGYYHTWIGEEKRKPWFFNIARSLKPVTPGAIKREYSGRYREEYDQKKWKILLHFYLTGVVEQAAFFQEYAKQKLKKLQ